MEKVEPADENVLNRIDKSLTNVNFCISTSMSYIRKLQGWAYRDLERRLPGISADMWARYLQPSYVKMRPLHVVAAYSWLTMVPMPSFYRGLNIRESYRGMDEDSIEAIIHCGILPRDQFRVLLNHLYLYLTDSQKTKADIFKRNILEEYSSLENYEDSSFLFPKALDIELFSYDYYRSVAIAFKEFRKSNNFSVETMSTILNLSEYRYKQCEDPEKPVPLPIDIAARLKLGFQLTDAMPFTSHMIHYPQLHTVRVVQHIRETKLTNLMQYIQPQHKKSFVTIIRNMAHIYQRDLKLNEH